MLVGKKLQSYELDPMIRKIEYSFWVPSQTIADKIPPYYLMSSSKSKIVLAEILEVPQINKYDYVSGCIIKQHSYLNQ